MSSQGGEATETQPLIAVKKENDGDVEIGQNGDTKPASSSPTVLEDVIDILQLAFPIFITSFSWVGVSSHVKKISGSNRIVSYRIVSHLHRIASQNRITSDKIIFISITISQIRK